MRLNSGRDVHFAVGRPSVSMNRRLLKPPAAERGCTDYPHGGLNKMAANFIHFRLFTGTGKRLHGAEPNGDVNYSAGMWSHVQSGEFKEMCQVRGLEEAAEETSAFSRLFVAPVDDSLTRQKNQ